MILLNSPSNRNTKKCMEEFPEDVMCNKNFMKKKTNDKPVDLYLELDTDKSMLPILILVVKSLHQAKVCLTAFSSNRFFSGGYNTFLMLAENDLDQYSLLFKGSFMIITAIPTFSRLSPKAIVTSSM